MAPLDDFTENLERLDWLLIDVEGYEVEVLKGAMKTLKKTKRAIVEIS
jgi:FkbM family methyltransferase